MNLLKKTVFLAATLALVFSLFSCSWEEVVVTPTGEPVQVPSSNGDTETAKPLTSNGTYGLTYDEGLDFCVVTGYHGTESDVFIPSEWNGKHVTGINSLAFNENSTVKTITITSSIKSVAKDALVGNYTVFCEERAPEDCETEGCTSKHPTGWHKDWYDKSADPEYVEWGCGSFGSFSWECNAKDDIVITGYIENPVNINIPSKIGSRDVVAIKSDAFKECKSLESISIPDSVKEIGSFAFYSCTSLKSVNLPDGVTVISSYLFMGCEKLEEVHISPFTTTISSSAFANCTSLKAISIPATVTKMEMLVFLNCSKLTIYINLGSSLPTGWHENWNPSGCKVIYENT